MPIKRIYSSGKARSLSVVPSFSTTFLARFRPLTLGEPGDFVLDPDRERPPPGLDDNSPSCGDPFDNSGGGGGGGGCSRFVNACSASLSDSDDPSVALVGASDLAVRTVNSNPLSLRN
jgi:hypothetical protein